MTATEIRRAFLDFFREKDHKLVPSAPIVNKDDPSLMFTNAGMNQFKDYFLGDRVPDKRRVADTQKCMRVSGKHNDLDDVGRDGTHHTMFEMLGNWSFGDYFKDEAIAWSWELLTDRLGIDPDRLYATVFEGAPEEGIPVDDEARQFWLRYLPEDRVLYGNKKDNFWEMGETGPCGPCTEIHVDLRSDEARAATPGRELVNVDGSGVVEIWNNVFIQFNRRADGSLGNLPERHVDTGMGFERLCMVLQQKDATYDTDIFTPILSEIERLTGHRYGGSYAPDAKSDMAMRVVADHLRAVAFTIADGQLPGSGGAGYVVRRILRRAVRYGYSFLDQKEPFMYKLMPVLVREMGHAFPELTRQQEQIERIIQSEERSFLQTLENGLQRFAALETTDGTINGRDAFELYDTFGFPIDLTRLLAEERGLTVDEAGFRTALQEQKDRSRRDAAKEVGDWTVLSDEPSVFIGYDVLSDAGARITKFRTVKVKDKPQYQLVLDRTPFYGESGGQVGDRGRLRVGEEMLEVIDTLKENDLTVHVVNRLPAEPDAEVYTEVTARERQAISNHHTAAHLLHAALHTVLGKHAVQKGQDVRAAKLRFDFSHFERPTAEELERIERLVNEKIRANIPLLEQRDVPIAEARNSGAMMLFGEKYGDTVRIITFDPEFSSELCGGTHVKHTGELGFFKITSESALAAGVRRIEGVAGVAAETYLNDRLGTLDTVRELLKGNPSPADAVRNLQEENRQLKKELDKLQSERAGDLKGELESAFEDVGGVRFLARQVPLSDAAAIKNLAFQLTGETDNAFVLLASEDDGKALLTLAISKGLAGKGEGALDAGVLIRELARNIRGGGGGQPFFATAGGKDPGGIPAVLTQARERVGELVASS
ncbi:alanyl-tRNA synthetase [Lewinella marina]|uniref:Alanine--tRNA ligase n=1 Tax=Neolewinella marina TaxID=438751 RepID=A0A2G0CJC4_9BACT|nr:alanine--tRNA ligase [Neolewinella marina]NJB84765.1 alanyl-tRNA synthetase [Neolewinella marina]PHL00076.1 alanine--tRNA ligase [Neolewinella marina]